MKICYPLLSIVLLAALLASGQDWQDCRTDSSPSFKQVTATVRRVTANSVYTGWDEKTFNRSGDLVSVAILQAFDDSEIVSPENLKHVLLILHSAFGCPSRCVSVIGDRQPRVTLLLLEHLRNKTRGEMRTNIDETTRFILQQASGTE